MSRPASRLLPLALATSLGCAHAPTPAPEPVAPAATPAPAAAPEAPSKPQVEARLSARPGESGCEQFELDGRPSDAPAFTAATQSAVKADPLARVGLRVAGTCSDGDVNLLVGAARAGGAQHVELGFEPKPSEDAPPPPPANAPPPEGEGLARRAAASQPGLPGFGGLGRETLEGYPRPGAAMHALANGHRRLALALFAKLRATEGNLFFSPLGVSAALALLDSAAGGSTAEALDRALGYGGVRDVALDAEGELFSRYRLTPKDEAQLSLAARLWPARQLPLSKGAAERQQKRFGTGIEPLDFGAGEAARSTINGWVKSHTRDRIPELLPAGALDGQTELVLTTAVAFHGTWQMPFPEGTANAPFLLRSGERVQVPLMRSNRRISGADVGEARIAGLGYGRGGTLEMVLIVPTKPQGLDALEAGLTADKLDGWLAQLGSTPTTVAMPRFSFRSQSQLQAPLAALGLGEAFATPKLPGLFAKGSAPISRVIHEAFITVDEKGTEAAAATAVIATRSAHFGPPLEVVADHPFLFLIRDRTTGELLFLGRVVDPRS